MTATRFCDSAGFQMLLVVHDRMAAQAVQLKIVIPAGCPVMRAIRLIGFDQILTIVPVNATAATTADIPVASQTH
jgi:anti-anti-sigma regulatory factor